MVVETDARRSMRWMRENHSSRVTTRRSNRSPTVLGSSRTPASSRRSELWVYEHVVRLFHFVEPRRRVRRFVHIRVKLQRALAVRGFDLFAVAVEDTPKRLYRCLGSFDLDFDDDDEDARTRAVRRVHDRRARTSVTRVARARADRVLIAARMLESLCEAVERESTTRQSDEEEH